MFEQLLTDIETELNRVSANRDHAVGLYRKLVDDSGQSLSTTDKIPETDRSLSDLDTATSAILNFGRAFERQQAWALIPRSWVVNFFEAARSTANNFESLSAAIEQVDSQHGGVGTVVSKDFTINSKNGTLVDLRKILTNLNASIDKAFESYFQLRGAISAPKFTEFGGLFDFFNTKKEDLDKTGQALEKIRRDSEQQLSSVKSATDETKAQQLEAQRFRTEAEADRKTITDYSSEASQKVEAIRATAKSAEELTAVVSNFQAQFKQFQDQLDTREAHYQSQTKKYNELVGNLDKTEKAVSGLAAEAQGMLKGATNAGLSYTFSEKQKETNRELAFARFAYYLSIVLLILLTVPLLIYVLPRDFYMFMSKWLALDLSWLAAKDTTQLTPEDRIAQVLARALLLIPGFLLVRFTSSRHERLFRLREHYSYKYSIAMSVDGFKQQAPEYKEEMAAAAFFELKYNPATTMEAQGSESKMINPIYEYLLKRIEGIRKKKEGG